MHTCLSREQNGRDLLARMQRALCVGQTSRITMSTGFKDATCGRPNSSTPPPNFVVFGPKGADIENASLPLGGHCQSSGTRAARFPVVSSSRVPTTATLRDGRIVRDARQLHTCGNIGYALCSLASGSRKLLLFIPNRSCIARRRKAGRWSDARPKKHPRRLEKPPRWWRSLNRAAA